MKHCPLWAVRSSVTTENTKNLKVTQKLKKNHFKFSVHGQLLKKWLSVMFISSLKLL